MTRSRLPWVFRLAATLLAVAFVGGLWWQHQPVGQQGRSFLAAAASACPAAATHGRNLTVAETARTLDRWAYARLGNLLLRDGRDRCRVDAARSEARQ